MRKNETSSRKKHIENWYQDFNENSTSARSLCIQMKII